MGSRLPLSGGPEPFYHFYQGGLDEKEYKNMVLLNAAMTYRLWVDSKFPPEFNLTVKQTAAIPEQEKDPQ